MSICVLKVTYLRLVAGSTVRIIGSAFVRDAYNRALQCPDGPALDLENGNIYIYWEHQGGFRLCQFIETVTYMSDFYPKPDWLIIHCGGNDRS
jgi:hypothetical protein